jgi:hypothetical protein
MKAIIIGILAGLLALLFGNKFLVKALGFQSMKMWVLFLFDIFVGVCAYLIAS